MVQMLINDNNMKEKKEIDGMTVVFIKLINQSNYGQMEMFDDFIHKQLVFN